MSILYYCSPRELVGFLKSPGVGFPSHPGEVKGPAKSYQKCWE